MRTNKILKLVTCVVLSLCSFFSYSQDVIVLGCQGELKEERLTIDSTKPKEEINSSRKVLTEIKIDKKNKVIRVQEKSLDRCISSKCSCTFNEDIYECKSETKEIGEVFSISVGRKTGITKYFWSLSSSIEKNNFFFRSNYYINGQFNCELKEKNKF